MWSLFFIMAICLGESPPDQLGLPEDRATFDGLCREHEYLVREFRRTLSGAMEDRDHGEEWIARRVGLLRDRDAVRRIELRLSVLAARRSFSPPRSAAELMPHLDWTSPSSMQVADAIVASAFESEAKRLAAIVRFKPIVAINAVDPGKTVVTATGKVSSSSSFGFTTEKQNVAPLRSVGRMAGDSSPVGVVPDRQPGTRIPSRTPQAGVCSGRVPVATYLVAPGSPSQSVGSSRYYVRAVPGVSCGGFWIAAPANGYWINTGPPVQFRWGSGGGYHVVGRLPVRSIGGS